MPTLTTPPLPLTIASNTASLSSLKLLPLPMERFNPVDVLTKFLPYARRAESSHFNVSARCACVVTWRLCGEKAPRSNVPSCRWETGISSGASSADNTEVKELRAAQIVDSGRWKAGFRLDIMEGVRTRTDGLGPVVDGAGWCSGREARNGRKVWRVRIGVRRRVFRRSESVEGGRVAIGEEG